MGCFQSRRWSKVPTNEEEEMKDPSQQKWKSVMNPGFQSPYTTTTKKSEENMFVVLKEIEVTVLGVPVATVQPLSQLMEGLAVVDFFENKNTFNCEDGSSQINIVIILDPLFVQNCAPILITGIVDKNGKQERFSSSSVAKATGKTLFSEGSIDVLDGSFKINFRGIPVGTKDHLVHYDNDEEYNKKIELILNESVKKLIGSLQTGSPDKAYALMSPSYRKLVSLEGFVQSVLEGQKEWKGWKVKHTTIWNIHHVYPCASVCELEAEAEKSISLTFVMLYNRDSGAFECLNFRWEHLSLACDTVLSD